MHSGTSVVALSGKDSDPSVNRRRALGFASGVHKAGQLGRVDQRRGGQRLSSPLRQVSEHYSCVLQRQQSGEVLSPSRQACVIRRPPRLRAPAIEQPCPCRDAAGGQSAGMVRREEGPVLTIRRIAVPYTELSPTRFKDFWRAATVGVCPAGVTSLIKGGALSGREPLHERLGAFENLGRSGDPR